MTIRPFPNDAPLDDRTAAALRDLLAPPGGEAYWTELEGSIMGRITTADLGWWGELTAWARPALAAAAVLVAVSTAALSRASEVEASAVYEDVVAVTTLPEDVVSRVPVDQADLNENLRTTFDP